MGCVLSTRFSGALVVCRTANECSLDVCMADLFSMVLQYLVWGRLCSCGFVDAYIIRLGCLTPETVSPTDDISSELRGV